ncbi:MAG: sugar-binding transcriptional regulator [Desulfopila sp.]
MDKNSELRLLVKIATLYYDERLNQSAIARSLNLSQSFVSRAIKRCHNEGLVKVSVIHPTGTFVALELSLQQKYGLQQMIVVDIEDNAPAQAVKRAVGSGAAAYLQTTLRPDDLVGISAWSTFISAMVEALHPRMAKARGVIQILGGVGHNRNLRANILTDDLAHLLDCPASFLPTTSEVRTPEEKRQRLLDPEIADVVKRFPNVDLAIVGIGTSEQSDLVRNLGIVYREETVKMLASHGAVGDICLHYYDKNGAPILSEEEDPVISISLAQLRNCPRVLALAGGLEKVAALKGAMAGGYIDVLVTDRLTALALLQEPVTTAA